MRRELIYLDYAAAAPVRPEVREAVALTLAEGPHGNPSSLHWAGRKARRSIAAAREQVARLVEPAVSPEQVIFTSGGTEANNLAIVGAVKMLAARRGCTVAAYGRPDAVRIAVSAIEHSSILAAVHMLQQEEAVAVDRIAVDAEGIVVLEALEESIERGAAVVSVAIGNNEVGTVQPVAEIAALCAAAPHEVILHADAVQAACYLPLTLRGPNVAGPDLISLSAHKMGGLKGTGALLRREDVSLHPILVGGDQERGTRGGTENVIGIVGFGEAARLVREERELLGPSVAALRRHLEDGVVDSLPGSRLHGHPSRRLPHIATFTFAGARGELVLLGLDIDGIAASAGSACVAGRTEPSHVLQAMGLDPEQARDAVRFSLGRATQRGDVDRVLEVLPGIVARVRAQAPD